MKLCDVTQFYSPVSGGVKRYIQERQKFIVRGGEHEHLLIIPGERTERIRQGRTTVCTIRSPRVDRTSRYRFILDLPEVRRIIREEHPDIIECGDPYHVAWAALEEAETENIPAVAFYHSHFPDAYLRTVGKYAGSWVHAFVQDYARAYIEKLYTCFACTLVPSPHLARLLKTWGVQHAVPVRLGVDTSIFHPGSRNDALRKEWGIDDGRILLLSVGRLSHEKNIRTLLHAFEILCEQQPGRFYLAVVGDGPLQKEVLECARKTGALRWHSYYQDSCDLLAVYHAADLFVHPGVCETFGLVTVESQACGLPVVGVRGTNMDRLVFSGLEFWASSNTPDSLARAIGRMADQPVRDMGLKASETVLRDFDWNTVFAELFAVYQKVCQKI